MIELLRDYAALWIPGLALAIYLPFLIRALKRGNRQPQVWIEPEDEPVEITYIQGPVDMGLTHERDKSMFVIGVLLVLVGIAISAYLGVWLLFIGGIAQIVTQIQAWPNIDSLQIAMGVARVVFTGAGIWVGIAIAVLGGVAISGSNR